MKRIIVPIDFSEDSINALKYAIPMANSMQADLRMMFVKKSEKFEMPFYLDEESHKLVHTIQGYFDKIIEKYAVSYEVIDGVFDYKIRTGTVYREIVNQAKYGDAYCIVMGAHGASGFEEFFIGSNSFKVVSNADCPVVTIRSAFQTKPVERILMPMDSSKETRKKIALVAEIAAMHQAEVHILGVYESENKVVLEKVERHVEQAENYLKEKNIKIKTEIIRGENNTGTAIEYAVNNDIDLITIMREQVETMFSMFFSSYAQQMVNKSPVPVLSIPN